MVEYVNQHTGSFSKKSVFRIDLHWSASNILQYWINQTSRWFCRYCFLSDHKAECLYKPETNFSDFSDIVFCQTIKLNVFINLNPIFPSLLLLFKFYLLINITNFWSHLFFWRFSPLFVFIPRWYSPFWFYYKYCYQRKFETLIITSVNNSLNNLVMLK